MEKITNNQYRTIDNGSLRLSDAGKIVKHFDNTLNCKVMTKQESEIELNYLTAITCNNRNGVYTVEYNPHSDLSVLPNNKNIFSSVH